MDLLSDLNPEQRAAVLATEGPVLLLAGAGSGKTRVLTHRIAHLVQDCGVHPSEIFAVTFTNKAAGEMRDRVRRLLGPEGGDVWVSTFHSACVRILRAHIHELGRNRNFVIYDDKEQLDVIKKVIESLNLDAEQYAPRVIAGFIDRAKNDGQGPGDLTPNPLNPLHAKLPGIYEAYQAELLRNNAMDFGDLILETLTLFARAPQVLEWYQNNLRYVMVDEYQDTNKVQYLLMQAFTKKHKNLCVVGDDDQSIYSWRGADIRNILEFNRDFPGATVIKLEQNYRSTKNILTAAHRMVEKNLRRTAKTLWTENPPGDPILLYTAEDDRDEVRFVLDAIRKEQRGGLALRQMAIMYRMNSLTRMFEEGLLRERIAYQVVGGMKFYERKEIKDVLSLLRLLINPADGVSFRRVVENFTKGIGKATLDKIDAFSRSSARDMLSAAEGARAAGVLSSAAAGRIEAFAAILRDLSGEAGNLGVRELSVLVLEKTGYLEELKRQNTEEARNRLENLGELLSSMGEHEEKNPGTTTASYLDQVALVSDADTIEDTDQLTLMTLHAAKGLEYPAVFLIGLEQNIFPHSRSQNDPAQMEEERRLCYVGITRAEKRLYLSHAKRRRLWGDYEMFQPSMFLGELPRDVVQRVASRKPAWTDAPRPPLRHVEPSGPAAHHPETVSRQIESRVGKFRAGIKVSHPTFGVGLVMSAEGEADNPKLVVKFNIGPKTIMARYVPLEIID